MNSILTYLYKNENINGYIIRALLNTVRGFHYKLKVDNKNNITGLAAMWEEEKSRSRDRKKL